MSATDGPDHALWPYLTPVHDPNAALGRISAEELLSGRGLMNIYRALCKVEGNLTPRYNEPAEVSAAGISVQTVWLGRRSACLPPISAGGRRSCPDLHGQGRRLSRRGISPKILPALQSGEFRAAFEDKAPHQSLLHGIPTFVVTHPQAALHGLAAFAMTPSEFGLATEGRHWRR